MPSVKDITGQRFGRLTVVAQNGNNKQGQALWLCRCNCGATKIVGGRDLRRGHTKSCGCFKTERLRAGINWVHGHVSNGDWSPEYHTWRGMVQRCQNPNHEHFKYYGGRGIVVADRWLTFSNFFADMGERPPGMTLDRIDRDGNYEPGNVRWATAKQQASNRRAAAR